VNEDPAVGWAIDNTHKIIRIANPSAVTVAGWIRVIGVK
jgi:hypothetical protein